MSDKFWKPWTVEGWMDGWKGGWKEAKAGLRIAYSNQKAWLLNGWVDGWMGGLKLNYNGGPFSKMVRFL